MPEIPKRYPGSWRGWPPSMPAGDNAVWQRFLNERGAEWPEYAYDVELTGGVGYATTNDQVMQATWMRLTAKRVDAIAFRAGRATLIEIRTRAAWQSVGQLIGYRHLFPIDHPDIPIDACMIVTDFMDPAIAQVAAAEGLIIYTVKPVAAAAKPAAAIP